MQFKNEDIKDILERYNFLLDKINDVLSLHSKLDECYYEITEIHFAESCLTVNVEYYKWQDTNHDIITFDLELLTNPDEFEKFKNEMDAKIQEKLNGKNQKAILEKQRAIEAAKKLLKENGISNI